MCILFFANEKLLVGLVMFMSVVSTHRCFHASPMPCNASLPKSCPASLYYVPKMSRSLDDTMKLFHGNTDVINRTVDGFVISVNCSCPTGHNEFTWHVDYTVQTGDTWDSVSSKFGGILVDKRGQLLIAPQTVTLDLLCGCSENVDVVTYAVRSGDTLFLICSRFNASVEETATLNGLDDPGLIHEGDVIFIPARGLQNLILRNDNDPKPHRKSKLKIHIMVGVISAAVAVMLLLAAVASWNHRHKKTEAESEASLVLSFNSDKATVFPYNEVRDSTSNFSMSLKIGQGSYGSVYLGKLRGTDMAIKRMTNTKSKEFLSELNILCKVHHSNVIELIGYAAGGDSLFLVYEYAQNGALSDHLHAPSFRGHKPLPWTTRVQIALDAAKGLEYIHMLTKPYYVHRDVKTSNILLDSNFRAKIADFGLVKLLEQSPEVGAAASRIVGTFGYLAPEYVRDGCVTTKSDVYAFGVVLMELITAQQALTRDASPGNDQYGVHRSLVDYMLLALNNTGDVFTELTQCVDPDLTHYHKDSLLQLALLSKDCVDDDWNRRPDMSKVVLRLSHILTRSREWERLECSSLGILKS